MRFKQNFTSISVTAALLITSGSSFGQSYFNRTAASVFTGSARSMAMGFTSSVSDRSSGILLSNPAGLADAAAGIGLDFQSRGTLISERRSMDMMDTFGDFLTSGDYVINRNNDFAAQGGAVYGTHLAGQRFGFGISFGQLTNFNYQYREEVRGRLSPADGVIDNRDPLLGYHVYTTAGDLNHFSLGTAVGVELSKSLVFSVGFSYHFISAGDFIEEFYVDTILTTSNYLAGVAEQRLNTNFPGNEEFTIGFSLRTSLGLSINFAFDSDYTVKTDSVIMPSFGTDAGLPIYANYAPTVGQVIDYADGMQQVFGATRRLGLDYQTVGEVPMTVAFEWQRTTGYTLALTDTSLKMPAVNSWKFGFEYLAMKEIPVRAGLEFRESPFAAIGPTSIYTFGTGKQIGDFTIDVAGGFASTTYDYPDLFPVTGDVRPDLDHVTESRIDVLISVSYSL
ncbi:MAG: hypothetical protein ABIA75_12730 [Candidatus Neomarinimicrobiota bacterium]